MFNERKPRPRVKQTKPSASWKERHPKLHEARGVGLKVGYSVGAGILVNAAASNNKPSIYGTVVRGVAVQSVPILAAHGHRKYKQHKKNSRGGKKRGK